jgi:hypothetical protein
VDGGEVVDQCPVEVEEYGLHAKLFFIRRRRLCTVCPHA